MIKTPYLILSEKCKQILTFGLSRDVTRCLAWQCHNQTRKVNLFDVVNQKYNNSSSSSVEFVLQSKNTNSAKSEVRFKQLIRDL
jgi:hypothetical protein